MESLFLLNKLIGHQRTIIITCPECRNYMHEINLPSAYFCLGGMLRRHDEHQKDFIRYHLAVYQCTRIIVAGHHHCGVVNKIHGVNATNISSPYILEWKTDTLLRGYSRQILQSDVKIRMMTEMNVLEQLQILSELHFVKTAIKSGTLSISGIVIDEERLHVKEIFKNGVIYNDLIGSN